MTTSSLKQSQERNETLKMKAVSTIKITSETESEYGVFWGDSLYQYSSQKKPIVEGILYEHDVVCLSALPGVGKSLFTLQLMGALTTGEALLGTYPVAKPQNVLYIQTEGDRSETIERITNMKKGIGFDDSRWVHMNLPSLALNTEHGFQELMRLANGPKMKYDVVVLDPIYTTIKGSLSSDEVCTDWIRNMRKFKAAYDCALWANHHEGKLLVVDGKPMDRSLDTIFGSTFWAAFFNHNFKLRKQDKIHILESGKQRSAKIVDKLEMQLKEPVPLMFVHSTSHDAESTRKCGEFIKGTGDWTSVRALQDGMGMSRASVFRALNKLKEHGLLERKEESGTTYYRMIDYDRVID